MNDFTYAYGIVTSIVPTEAVLIAVGFIVIAIAYSLSNTRHGGGGGRR